MSTRVTGWTAASLTAIAFAVTMLGTTLPTPLYPLYAAKFGFGELMTTVIFATYAVGVVAGLLLFGHWSDQLGRKPLLTAGLILSAASAVAFLLASALGWLFLGRLLSGLSAGIFTGTATATIVDLAPSHGKPRAALIAAAANMGGLGAGPLLAGVLAQYAPKPLQLSFLVDLALIAVGLVCLFFVKDPVSRAQTLRLRPRSLHVPEDIRGVFTRATIAGFAGFAVLGLFTSVSPAFLATVLHKTNHALVGVVVVILFAASVIGQTLSGRLELGQALRVGCGALVVGMIVIAISLPAASLTLLLVGAVIAGIGQGLSFRAGLGSVTDATPAQQRGEVTSTYFTVLYVGISLPVIGVGALASAAGLVTAGVVFAILVAALAALCLGLLIRARGESANAESAA